MIALDKTYYNHTIISSKFAKYISNEYNINNNNNVTNNNKLWVQIQYEWFFNECYCYKIIYAFMSYLDWNFDNENINQMCLKLYKIFKTPKERVVNINEYTLAQTVISKINIPRLIDIKCKIIDISLNLLINCSH